MFVIKAEERTPSINLTALRKSGKIPAVFYGAGKKATSISISTIEFKKIWREAGESSAVKISMGNNNDIDSLIYEVQVDPVIDEPINVDFLAIDMKKKIQVNVPLIFEGISEAVKSGIGNLVKVLHEIEIEALPADLPHNLAVDISSLQTLENQIFVADIKLPKGVVAITNGADVVASIVAQVEEKEEVVAPVDLSAIEVKKKGKKALPAEGGGEAGEEGKVASDAGSEKPKKKPEKK